MKKDTKILHEHGSKDPVTGALSIPIYSASTYDQKGRVGREGYEYIRSGNPTREALEKVLAGLENAPCGYAFSSGVAAIHAALTAVLSNGDHVVVTENCYGGTYRMLTDYLARFGIETTFADTSDPAAVVKAVRANTRAIFLESPSNPLLKIIDLKEMAKIAKKHGLISMIDNTFLTPYFLKPLDLGIDISIHSATKYLGGHSDLLAGAVMTRTEELGKKVQVVQNTVGAVLSPENSWVLLRGIKTLAVRMKAQEKSSFTVANWLKGQKWAKEIYYPGLPDHPGHSIVASQASGFGAIISFKTDSVERAEAIMKKVKIWSVAVSLGGVESILSYPAKMSHAAIPEKERQKIGITDDLIRLSIGLEDPEDLIADLEQSVN